MDMNIIVCKIVNILLKTIPESDNLKIMRKVPEVKRGAYPWMKTDDRYIAAWNVAN